MTQDQPTLRQQIEAVEWAAANCEFYETKRRLEAAAEMLKTWEYALEVLN